MLRRMRSGSKYQVRISATSSSTIAMPTLASSEGKTFIRNETVSASITIRSTKLTVISSTSCLNCDSRISSTSQASDIAAATAGRPNSTIQQKLKKAPGEQKRELRDRPRLSVDEQDRKRRQMQRHQQRDAPGLRADGRGVEQAGGQGSDGGRHRPIGRTRARLLTVPAGRRSLSSNCNQTVMARARRDLPPIRARPAVNAQAGAARFTA